MDLLQTTEALKQRVVELRKAREKLPKLVDAMAEARGIYDSKMEKEIMTLKAGGTPVTLIRDIAKGKAFKERIEADKAEGLLSAQKSVINAIQTEIEAIRSISKHLSTD